MAIARAQRSESHGALGGTVVPPLRHAHTQNNDLNTCRSLTAPASPPLPAAAVPRLPRAVKRRDTSPWLMLPRTCAAKAPPSVRAPQIRPASVPNKYAQRPCPTNTPSVHAPQIRPASVPHKYAQRQCPTNTPSVHAQGMVPQRSETQGGLTVGAASAPRTSRMAWN